MAIKSNPADFVQRWRAGVAASGARYTSGVQNSSDWAAAATDPSAAQARAAGWNAAQNSGKIDRGIQNLGTAGWRTVTVAKAGNWQTGVNSPLAQQHVQSGAQRLFGMLSQAVAAADQTPRGGIDANVARMTAFVRSMHDQKVNG